MCLQSRLRLLLWNKRTKKETTDSPPAKQPARTECNTGGGWETVNFGQCYIHSSHSYNYNLTSGPIGLVKLDIIFHEIRSCNTGRLQSSYSSQALAGGKYHTAPLEHLVPDNRPLASIYMDHLLACTWLHSLSIHNIYRPFTKAQTFLCQYIYNH